MSRVANIDRYLRAYFAADQIPKAEDHEPPELPFVTISRQPGIGGHAIADPESHAVSADFLDDMVDFIRRSPNGSSTESDAATADQTPGR